MPVELIHSIRVLEGPYAPQQGNFAVAGSADYQLGLDRRGLTAEYTYGSFNTQRLLMTYGPRDAPNGTFAGAEYFQTDGFGANRSAKRGTAIGQLELPVGQKGTLLLNAIAYYTEYDNAGVVRDDDYQSGRVDFYGTEDPQQSGNTASRAQVSATYENRFKDMDVLQQVYGVYRTMRLRENWTGFLLDVQEPTQQPHGAARAISSTSISTKSPSASEELRAVARQPLRPQAGGRRRVLRAHRSDRLDAGPHRGAGQRNSLPTTSPTTSTLGDVGVYLDGNLHFLKWLSLRGGVRADMFMFDVLNNCAQQSVDTPSETNPQTDVSCFSQYGRGQYREPFVREATAAGAVLPRGSLILGPIEHFMFTASLGTGVRSVDPSYVNQANQTPFIVADSRDLGVAYGRTFEQKTAGPIEVSVKSSFFQTHVGQDLIFDPTEGRNTLSGGSTRTRVAGAQHGSARSTSTSTRTRRS